MKPARKNETDDDLLDGLSMALMLLVLVTLGLQVSGWIALALWLLLGINGVIVHLHRQPFSRERAWKVPFAFCMGWTLPAVSIGQKLDRWWSNRKTVNR